MQSSTTLLMPGDPRIGKKASIILMLSPLPLFHSPAQLAGWNNDAMKRVWGKPDDWDRQNVLEVILALPDLPIDSTRFGFAHFLSALVKYADSDEVGCHLYLNYWHNTRGLLDLTSLKIENTDPVTKKSLTMTLLGREFFEHGANVLKPWLRVLGSKGIKVTPKSHEEVLDLQIMPITELLERDMWVHERYGFNNITVVSVDSRGNTVTIEKPLAIRLKHTV